MSVFGWLRQALAVAASRRSEVPVEGDRAVLPHVVIQPPPAPLWRGGVPPEVITLSKAFEGFRTTPYRCSAGKWTIGYGSTRDLYGRPVTAFTLAVTEAQAVTMALRDLTHAAEVVARTFPAGLPQRWGAVMVLMANNMNDPAKWGPTLVALLRQGEWRRAAEQMKAYRNARVNGVLTPQLGLRRRRWAEAAYALGMNAEDAKRRAWSEITTAEGWPALP